MVFPMIMPFVNSICGPVNGLGLLYASAPFGFPSALIGGGLA